MSELLLEHLTFLLNRLLINTSHPVRQIECETVSWRFSGNGLWSFSVVSGWHTWQRGRVGVDAGSSCPAEREGTAAAALHPLASTLVSLPGPAALRLPGTVIGSRGGPLPTATHCERAPWDGPQRPGTRRGVRLQEGDWSTDRSAIQECENMKDLSLR